MTTPAEYIATAIAATCDVEYALPYRPPSIAGRMAFVAPSDTWKDIDERFVGYTVGLDVYIFAATGDLLTAQSWHDDQTAILASATPIDVGTDEVVVTGVYAPVIYLATDGTTFLGCRVSYSRFSIE